MGTKKALLKANVFTGRHRYQQWIDWSSREPSWRDVPVIAMQTYTGHNTCTLARGDDGLPEWNRDIISTHLGAAGGGGGGEDAGGGVHAGMTPVIVRFPAGSAGFRPVTEVRR